MTSRLNYYPAAHVWITVLGDCTSSYPCMHQNAKKLAREGQPLGTLISGVSRGGAQGAQGARASPRRLRGMQLINTNMPKFITIDNVTSSLLHKNALLSFKIAS